MKSMFKMLLSGVLGLAVIGAMMFVPAGTFNYWQAWVILAVLGNLGVDHEHLLPTD